LKLKYDKLLSTSAFNFDLRRYIMGRITIDAAADCSRHTTVRVEGRGLHSCIFQLNLSRF
jgi:hypothetical protein